LSVGGQYNTGIQSWPSGTVQQYQTALGRFNQIGRQPVSRPVGPVYGGAPPAPGGIYNQSRTLLGTDAGNQASNAFSNQVNQDQANLALGQAGAQSQAGIGMQGALSNVYSQALNRGADLNTAQTENALKRQGIGYGLAGTVLDTGLGLAGQAVNPLLGGIFNGIGSIPSGISSLFQPGIAGAIPSAQTTGLGNSALSSILNGIGGIGVDPLAALGSMGGATA
jgi:hypothetical protein